MNIESRLTLSAGDIDSSTWKKISAHYEARLDMLRRKNDGNLSFDETNKLRGRIAEVKRLLGSDPANKKGDREADLGDSNG